MTCLELHTILTDIVRKYPRAELIYAGEIGDTVDVSFFPYPDESLRTIDATMLETPDGFVIQYDNEILEV